jgi:hypothetical protein
LDAARQRRMPFDFTNTSIALAAEVPSVNVIGHRMSMSHIHTSYVVSV